MVILKSSRAIGSTLGLGTHVWLEIELLGKERITYSGSKMGKVLGIIKNYKRDYDKPAHRGFVEIDAPHGFSQHEWDQAVLASAEHLIKTKHQQLVFDGNFPYRSGRGNCCTIATEIIETAGGCIPKKRLRGFTPGLKMQCKKLSNRKCLSAVSIERTS